ncbi:spore germination protein [Gracilibacillus oryzae]|uniref:Spore germination protein n=1 Tax=Gracilibacillus oryzae TaxID=1672701 RepID=A0A7C8KV67_9BACI|nr:spore germination protein [Gracilibacillus oryzae]KAB8136246.1 spore germination protein [Gracilibacillus oryzae]
MRQFKKSKDQEKKIKINKSLSKNIDEMKETFSYGLNKDFCMRTLEVKFSEYNACLFYYGSIVDGERINTHIIKPLLEQTGDKLSNIVTIENLEEVTDLEKAIQNVNSGKAILFIDNDEIAYAMDVAKFEYRAVSKAENESVIKGPQDAFTESLNANISLIRKQLHNHQLVNEAVQVGERSVNEVNILYIKDMVKDDLLSNLRERLENISIDSIRNIEVLEQHLEERPYSLIPTILYTERPDKATAFLEDGYIILLMNTSSACLIVPVTFWSFYHSPEDRYLRFLYGNFSRAIRLLCFYLTTMISATYVAIANFHSEMIPPDLLLAITASRERIPFPLVFEVLIMEIAFELIREAGVRIPNPLGPTIGIVGALILGQAAVEANIISPIIVIVAALSGLSSFGIPDLSMNFTVRILRFIFILAAASFGMLGLIGALILFFMYVVSIRSYGVPFFSPVAPNFKSSKDTVFRKVLKKEYFRPGFLDLKDSTKRNK